MNQSTRRKSRHLLHFLLTWVLIGTQITLPLGALLAAVQPTPQMAQAVAQRAGLGDKIAAAAGKATAWAQPLWGQPKTAAAQATNSIWGIKNYTDFGYLNTAVSPWTWVTVATLSGGNYNAAAAITRSQGIIFNQTTRVFHLVNPTTGALTALTLTNAGSIPRTLNYNVATYDPATNRYFAALENDQYGHIFTVNTATNQITYVSEINAGTSINSDDWVFVNGKVVGYDYGSIETWDVTNNTYAETGHGGVSPSGEVAGMWLNQDGTLGAVDQTTNVYQYDFVTNNITIVSSTSNAAFPNGGEPNDLAGAVFGLTPNLPTGVLNQAYSGSVTGAGGAPPYSNYTATGLPTGLSLNSATGAVTGTPTASGTFPVNFGVTDSENYTATLAYNLVVITGVAKTSSPRIYTRNNPTSFLTSLPNTNVDQTVTVYNMSMEETKLSGGWLHHCAITSADALTCWGVNDHGELGIGNTTNRNSPQTPLGIPGTVYTVQGSSDHTCVLTYSGDVYCTGYNDHYQLGDGTTTQRSSYVKVLGIADATSIGIGYRHGCATLNTGGIKCWGYNGYGQLGDNSTTTRSAPVMVSGTSGTVYLRVVATELSTCALDSNNAVTCWGYNGEGQLGDGTVTQRLTPVAVTGMSEGVKAIYSGQGRNFCGVMYDGSVKCWGWGGNNGTNSTIPVTISGVSNARMVSVGQVHGCAVQFDGTLKCWGDNGYQKVLGAPGGTTWTATAVTGVSGAVDVATTDATTCVRLSSGALQCWGYNGYGQVGDSTNADRGAPTSVTGYAASGIKAPDAPASLTISAQAISGTNAGNFSIFGTTCSPLSYTMPTNQTCAYTIRFNGPAYGAYTANLNITADAINSVTTVLNGNVQTAPGGVATGLGVWLRADYGTSSTTDGDLLTDWADFSAGANDVTQPTAGNQPKFKAVNLNFNPALEFDGSNDVLYKSDGSTIIPNQTDPVSMLTVSTQRAGSGWWQTLLSFSGPADYPALHWLDGRQALYIDGVQDFRHSVVIPYNTPTMFVSRANNATPRDLRMANNGLSNQDTSTVGSGTFPAASGSKLFSVGSEVATGSETLNGFLNEGIVYNRFLSDAEVNRIHTYFAIKYSVMFDNGATNYVATDGTTVIWDATANSGYKNNIAGIGRDDAEALNQKQSKSINSGFQPTIGLGAIAASNAANTGVFSANSSFLLWGDNNQAASYGASYNPTSFTPAAGYNRMNRVWKVQETGTITNVVVQATGADHLLVSSDPTFATGVTEVAFSSGSATVNFTDGQYFTFGKNVTGPGGVVADLWHRADLGITESSGTISTWTDQAQGLVADGLTANVQPSIQAGSASLFNFNPGVVFGNTAQKIGNISNQILTNTSYDIFSVTKEGLTGGRFFNLGRNNTTFDGSNWDSPGLWTNGSVGLRNQAGSILYNSNPPGAFASTTPTIMYWKFTPTTVSKGVNGAANGSNGTFGTNTQALGGYIIGQNAGAGTGGDDGGFTGTVGEIIVFGSRNLTAAERSRVDSYLAIKYGVTLDQSTATNYLAADSSVIWDATANSTYKNNIAGIGRDDASALTQKQAKSVNSDFQVTIGLGAIAASNVANANTFSTNKSYLIWGDNGQAASYGASYTPGSFTPGGGYFRMNRIWKVQETGTITNVVVMADGAEHILVSSDPTFTTGVTEIDMSSGSATVNFSNGQFFTFGKAQVAPGAVVSGLAFWSKADDAGCAPGAACADWDDRSANGNPIETIGAMTLQAADAAHNFHPYFSSFSTANYFKDLNSSFATPWPPIDVTEVSVFAVARANSLTDDGRITGMDNDDNYADEPGLSIFDGSPAFYRFSSGPGRVTLSDDVVVNSSAIFGARTAGTQLTVGLNGKHTASALTAGGGFAGDIFNIGYGIWDINGPFPGDIQEVIWYRTNVSDTERQRIESYLALKYGITLDQSAAQNYLAGDGTTVVWNATAHVAYSNNIAGIGRDDASALNQKQATSTNPGFQPTIGLGTIAASNAANSNTFATNKSFLIWGNNNAATTLTASYNGGSNNRVARVWKVQETGTVGAVKVVIPRSAFPTVGLRSLIVHSSDANFGTVDRTYPLVVSSGNYEATVNFNNGDFFTFSSSFTIPEINVTPGTLDFGEINTGMVSPAQAVTIQNEGEVSLSISNISLSGTDAARFAISSNNCGATLSAGASCTVQITFAPTTAGSRSALLVITSNDSDEGTVNVALSGRTPGSGGGGTPGTYNLAVTKSASTANATIGVPFTYTITVYNKGTIAASNVTLTDQLPAGVTFGSANATGGGNCNHSSGTVTCTWPSLAGGATATVTISVTP